MSFEFTENPRDLRDLLDKNIRVINPAVAVLTLLTLGDAQTRLALLSLTRKVREIRG